MIKLYDSVRDEKEKVFADKVRGMKPEQREKYLERKATSLLNLNKYSGDRTLKRISRE